MIEAKGITKFYGTFQALNDVSFRVERGEVLGFLGPNGAGKSTTMKVLTTYISASEGTAVVDGFDVHAQPQEVRKRLGYLPETPPLYGEMTVEEYLKFAGRARGLGGAELKKRVDKVVSDTALTPKFKNLVNELSKGYRQRVGIAQALIHDPPALILDEPTSGLDPNQIIGIRKLITDLRDAGKALIFSTHILQEAASVAGRLVIVNNGRKVADGRPDELAARVSDNLSIKLMVRGRSDMLVPSLSDLDHVTSVSAVAAPEGYSRYEVSVRGGNKAVHDACENIAQAVIASGLKLAELSPQTMTLEDVFLRLLNDGKKTAAPEVRAAAPEEDPSLKATSAGTRMVHHHDEHHDHFDDKPPTETAISAGPISEALPEDDGEKP
ncbi:MAG: ABC transporter ATP-binding protein [Planctomycetes bacterium]|nr:ABC transporter ATP-binding protein [Planctomycetota bacterium]